jgi:hypothetical protein
MFIIFWFAENWIGSTGLEEDFQKEVIQTIENIKTLNNKEGYQLK